ncbi:MAG: site-specific DNA-methyltransferase, partial [Bacillota bacterium]
MENNKLDGFSMDLESDNKQKLQAVFPECFAEGKLDIDKLLSLCGEYIDEDFEKYKFEWKGKANCLKVAQKRSRGTLRPKQEESVNFDTTENLYIEGDNLEVLKLLQTAYYRKVKMIYIDPPYNTGHDFVYEDDFAEPLANYKEVTSQATKSNPETMGRFHTNWLNMMYPRLRLAANLLADDGVIFISIDDKEVENLKKLCNEVFGEENFAGTFPWRKRTTKTDVPFGISQDFEWILVYAKSNSFVSGIPVKRKYYKTDDYPNDRWRLSDLTTQKIESQRPNSAFDLVNPKDGKVYKYNPKRLWAITKDTFDSYYEKGKIVFPHDYDFLNISIPSYRVFESEDKEKAFAKYGSYDALKSFSTALPKEVGMTEDGTSEIDNLIGNKIFPFPKPSALIKQMILSIHNENDIILDFFSGSATTAHAVMQLNAEDGGNRKFICVQLPELTDEKSEAHKNGYHNICEIGKERIRRAGKKILEETPKATLEERETPLDVGFKVLSLDTSNLYEWDGAAIENRDPVLLRERLSSMIDGVKDDRSDMDVVYEVMIKMGVTLDVPVTHMEINGKLV